MTNFLFSLVIYKGKRKYTLNITQPNGGNPVKNIPPGSILFPLMLTNFYYDSALESLCHIQPISLLLFLPFPNPP